MSLRKSLFASLSYCCLRTLNKSLQTPKYSCVISVRKYSQHSSTIDSDEVNKFSQLSKEWWDVSGDLKALHTLNKLRVPLIRDGLLESNNKSKSLPLEGMSVLDVGCGGGLLAEPLARLGAEVTGIDASTENIGTAVWHSKLNPVLERRLTYLDSPVEDLANKSPMPQFDGVVASEILEHVSDPSAFVASCCSLVKPGGSIFLTTMNKTRLAYLLAVFAAEKILKIVPDGAHDWNKFVPIEDLKHMLAEGGFETRLVHGMTLNPLTLQWKWVADTNINYAIHAVKKKE